MAEYTYAYDRIHMYIHIIYYIQSQNKKAATTPN